MDAVDPVVAHQHVGGLDVAVDDPDGVGVLEAVGELGAHPDRQLDRHPAALAQEPSEVAAGRVLGHDEGTALVLAVVVDRHDVG